MRAMAMAEGTWAACMNAAQSEIAQRKPRACLLQDLILARPYLTPHRRPAARSPLPRQHARDGHLAPHVAEVALGHCALVVALHSHHSTCAHVCIGADSAMLALEQLGCRGKEGGGQACKMRCCNGNAAGAVGGCCAPGKAGRRVGMCRACRNPNSWRFTCAPQALQAGVRHWQPLPIGLLHVWQVVPPPRTADMAVEP